MWCLVKNVSKVVCKGICKFVGMKRLDACRTARTSTTASANVLFVTASIRLAGCCLLLLNAVGATCFDSRDGNLDADAEVDGGAQ